MLPEHVTRAPAELRRVIDGDTYVLLVNLLQDRGMDEGATTMQVRLRDYSTPGRYTLPGIDATAAARALLTSATLTVELLGEDTIGRRVGWLWAGQTPVGPALAVMGHAVAGSRRD